jgi:hypothetical protein
MIYANRPFPKKRSKRVAIEPEDLQGDRDMLIIRDRTPIPQPDVKKLKKQEWQRRRDTI